MGEQRSARPAVAWQVFVILGALLGAHAVYLMVLPSVDPEHWREFTTDPEMLSYLRDEFRSSGAVQLGFSIFSIVVSVRWFRAGDPYAWAVLWFYPLLFTWLAFTTCATGLWVVLCLVAVAALLASLPRAGTRPATVSD
jgi:hypothetical protein